MKLYIPTSSRNFSLIFETESISPEAFYSKRTFGNTRFRSIPQNLSSEYITLYSEPIKFDIHESQGFPMLLEVDITSLSPNLRDVNQYIHIDKEQIFFYPQTIYFDAFHFRCIFFEDRHRKETKIDNESYRSVKTVAKYTVDVESSTFFKPIKFPSEKLTVRNDLMASEIEKDKRFNHFKGFLYGYIIGELKKADSPDKIYLLRLLQEIQNAFTNAKSQILIRSSDFEKTHREYKSKWDYTPPRFNLKQALAEINTLCFEAERLYGNLFGSTIDSVDLATEAAYKIIDILKGEKADFLLIEQCNRIVSSLKARNRPFGKMQNALSTFFDVVNGRNGIGSDESEVYERVFKSSIIELYKKIESFSTRHHQGSNGVNVNKFTFLDSHKVSFDRQDITLNCEEEYLLLEAIVSQILLSPRLKRKSEITREEKLMMIQSLGLEVSNDVNLQNTNYKNQLLSFYYSIKKYETFRLENVESTVLRNYVGFILKIDKLEDLIAYAESKKIEHIEIGISFWCAYNGFAEIDSKISRSIFGLENPALTYSFDNYLVNVLRVLDKETFDLQTPTVYAADEWGVEIELAEKQLDNQSSHQLQQPNNNDKLREYLKLLQLQIWKLSSVQNLNEIQKDDVSKGIEMLSDRIDRELHGEMVFIDYDYVNRILVQSIVDNNKKRRKKENKIDSKQLQYLLDELNSLK